MHILLYVLTEIYFPRCLECEKSLKGSFNWFVTPLRGEVPRFVTPLFTSYREIMFQALREGEGALKTVKLSLKRE